VPFAYPEPIKPTLDWNNMVDNFSMIDRQRNNMGQQRLIKDRQLSAFLETQSSHFYSQNFKANKQNIQISFNKFESKFEVSAPTRNNIDDLRKEGASETDQRIKSPLINFRCETAQYGKTLNLKSHGFRTNDDIEVKKFFDPLRL